MKIHLGGRLFVAAAVLAAVAVCAAGFLVALGVRSVVAGPGASPDPPNPGHSWDRIELPPGVWAGLNADLLDGLQSTEIQDADDHVTNADHATTADSAVNADLLDGLQSTEIQDADDHVTNADHATTADSAVNADLLDGAEAAALEESAEIDADIAAHTAIPDAHHTKTTDASEIVSGTMAPARIEGTAWTSLNDGALSGLDADLLDGLQSTEIQDADDHVTNADHATTADSAVNADLLDSQHASAFAGASHNHDAAYWKLTGNSGTTPGTNFLGTTDNKALELKVNGSRALRLEPNVTSPNVIGGYSGNTVTSPAYGAAICGGGFSLNTNRVTDYYGTVGGGGNNQAGNPSTTGGYEEPFATVGGGYGNDASGNTATIAGGYDSAASGSYDTVGGGYSNDASGGSATVGGGDDNTASGGNSTVAGGAGNTASGSAATVGGGYSNTASALVSTVGGGYANNVSADYATIAGGGWSEPFNPATGNRVTDNYGTVGGGGNNQAGDNAGTTADRVYATVAGGKSNTASGQYSTVPGGNSNTAQGSYSFAAGRRAKANNQGCFVWADSTDADLTCSTDNAFMARANGGVSLNTTSGVSLNVTSGGLRLESNATSPNVIGGYSGNSVTSGAYGAAICGGGVSGNTNSVTDNYGTVGGGYSNRAGDGAGTTADKPYATVAGGRSNTASGQYATVGGGINSEASGNYSTVPGGYDNDTATAASYSFAAGNRAKANNQGCFVWGDSTASDLTCATNNRFMARADGGVYLYTKSDLTKGVYLNNGGETWGMISASDRDLKENFQPVDGQQVLASLAEMPVTTWNYTTQDDSIRHMGPTAQDFSAAFSLDEDDRQIFHMDADGVALAAIQGLYGMVQELQAENADLEARVTALEGGAPLDDESAGPLASMMPAGWLLLAGLVFGGLVLAQRRLAGGRS